MAQKVTIVLEDDLDGGPADETVRFGFEGTDYEIDLSAKNARAFRKGLAPFIEHARKAGRGPARRSARTSGGRQGSGKSVSRDYAGPNVAPGPGGLVSAKPIRHYVGWSQQADPRKRIYNHGPAALRDIVYLEPGTMVDELGLKVVGKCPKCGERYAEDLVPGARRAATLRLLKLAHAATGEDAARLRASSRARRETGQEVAGE